MSLPLIAPQEAARRLAENSLVAVDIRETEEYRGLRLPGARLQPLSVLGRLPADADPEQPVVYFCRSGNRTKAAEAQQAARGHTEAHILAGGLQAWVDAGLPAERNDVPLSLERQVRIGAGGLVLLFVLLGWAVAPGFYALAGLIGAGLVFAGVTGFCGLARFLAMMPWNRKTE